MTASAAMTSPKEVASVEDNTEKAAAEKQTPTVDAIKAEAEKAGFDAAAEIIELCVIAGKPELAAQYVSERKPAAVVRKALLTRRADSQKDTEISSHTVPFTGTKTKTAVADSPLVKAAEALAKGDK